MSPRQSLDPRAPARPPARPLGRGSRGTRDGLRTGVAAGLVAALVAGALLLSGCAINAAPPAAGGAATIRVVAAENFWGSLAAQLGGSRATVTSIINNPDTDPHDYEPTAANARAFATAQLVIVNGIGYDAWATQLLAANPVPGRIVLNVGDLVGIPAGGNPHQWYSPAHVRRVVDTITADYARIDPAAASFFAGRHATVLDSALKPYFDLVDSIRARYAGTPVGASESIVVPLAAALDLRVLTPPSFLTAISEGSEPGAGDKTTIDRQIRARMIKVYVYNSQNVTPDVRAQVDAARSAGIPVTTVTETLVPAGASFQSWQVSQLTALAGALAQATGR